MAKARVLHSRLKVDEAGKSHKCQHSKAHVIAKGEKRLKVTEGRTDEHYCLTCAARFLAGTIESLQGLLAEVTLAQAQNRGCETGQVPPTEDKATCP